MEINVNNAQKYNQFMLRSALREARLITLLDVSPGGRIAISSVSWDDYWGYCDCMVREISQLKAAWTALIAWNYPDRLRRDYVRAYFLLLHRCLELHARGHDVLSLLKKIVGFETIQVSGDKRGIAAAIINLRHPVYLLSKLSKPSSPENPKYLPLVCPCGHPSASSALYWHYRRISLVHANGVQLFVYPPADVHDRPLSHALIGRLFACLTPRSDPWIRERSQSLFEGAFASLIANSTTSRVHLLDMACGSAKVTMTLCKKAFAAYRKSFDLTLVDVVRGNHSIANTFYHYPKIYGNLRYRRENLFKWVDENTNKPQEYFDIALLLRACNLFSRFSIQEIPYSTANELISQNTSNVLCGSQVLRPAELIEENKLSSINHGIGRLTYKNGWIYRQLSLSDYYKAMLLVTGGRLSAGVNNIYMPLRAFDENVLVLPSGRSLVAQLLNMTNILLIEDADMLPCHLEQHFNMFALADLTVSDLTAKSKKRGAFVYSIAKYSK